MASTAFFFLPKQFYTYAPVSLEIEPFSWRSDYCSLPGWTAPGIMVSVRADEEVSAGSAEGRETAYPCAAGWFNNRGGQTRAAQNPPAQQGTPA